jgi:hypothetical protein
MTRVFVFMLACVFAGPALAGSTMRGSGYANWFYACANREPMNILILHRDQTITQFSLMPGQTVRTFVQLADRVATRCDDRSVPLGFDRFAYIVTAP